VNRAPITGLYVPGDRSDRFDKAVAAGADLVILDLEDAVAPDAKRAALDAVTGWLRARGDARHAGGSAAEPGPVLQVRVNAGADHEVAALAETGTPIELRVPKVESAADVELVSQAAPGVPVAALLESALGLERAFEIASHPAVASIALGEADLIGELGADGEALLDYARARLVFAARAAGLPAPMLSVFPAIRDPDGLRVDTERGKRLGFVGRTAVHPAQLSVIADVFTPDADELAWAREVVAALADRGVATLASGEMVDAAMLPRARRILGLD
jgi:citrate lyase subunit beta/citryl-CoA lyase